MLIMRHRSYRDVAIPVNHQKEIFPPRALPVEQDTRGATDIDLKGINIRYPQETMQGPDI
ncbi:hypothetical protein CALK_2138 [Chitinivibrio alkaliphilus ACht1]|uniref:Uncharacterized protein n=1 Tax=Chitinivibrio alkaliphilus ACht1 TaxID=1313304 RepID=U7D5Z7_9BACT|nr:hypothetical protein CALK_2138 [Chitinivibrio alkaliphilus ACht1]